MQVLKFRRGSVDESDEIHGLRCPHLSCLESGPGIMKEVDDFSLL
jgi:hypothetical protein